ncbi:MAG TPA: PLP-dependent aspartate aminotransferase family protein [Pseudomonadales bacterium]|nr:PLP-dependent aspartate aminotransferase family protein [Pseudomonadales bacterium]
MDWSDDEFGFETRAIHAGQAPDPTTGAIITPLYLTSTYTHSAPGVHQGYDYTRSGNPTRRAFEDCVANLEGARFGFAMASGSVGTATIVHLLSAGDHVVACDDMYGGSYRLFERVFRQQGIDFSYVDMTDADNLAKAMRKNTRMVWVETPSNPLQKVVDSATAAEVAHASGALLAVDNTFMSPYFQRPIALGADLVMHSTTKYINGHSDLVGGVLITNDEGLAERLKFLSNAIGGIQSTFDAYMCLRSLKTLAVRMKAHESNALAVARFLESHPKIASVAFTGLPSHPQHALANRQMTGHGGMLTCNVAGDLDATRRFLSSVRVFALAESLGGVESLIEHPAIMTHASLPANVREQLGIGDNLVRLSIGIEAEADLLRDLDRALAAV